MMGARGLARKGIAGREAAGSDPGARDSSQTDIYARRLAATI
jgi:hypothetical protein